MALLRPKKRALVFAILTLDGLHRPGSHTGQFAGFSDRRRHRVQGTQPSACPADCRATGCGSACTLVGKPFGEETILRVAHQFQQATDWHGGGGKMRGEAESALAGDAAPRRSTPKGRDSTAKGAALVRTGTTHHFVFGSPERAPRRPRRNRVECGPINSEQRPIDVIVTDPPFFDPRSGRRRRAAETGSHDENP
jgi:hypothetical protein